MAAVPFPAGATERAGPLVAVASNFLPAARLLAHRFQETGGTPVRFAAGATGRLFAQIVRGAPFDAFLAADQARPARLERLGRVVPGSRFTYAVGQLVLWGPRVSVNAKNGLEILHSGHFRRLAMADPALATYGAAARQTLTGLGLYESLAGRLVFGANIAQTYAAIATGNAELGFVAASQLVPPPREDSGEGWPVPARYHDPIRQDAVLLPGPHREAARVFLEFLKGGPALALLRRFRYEPG